MRLLHCFWVYKIFLRSKKEEAGGKGEEVTGMEV